MLLILKDLLFLRKLQFAIWSQLKEIVFLLARRSEEKVALRYINELQRIYHLLSIAYDAYDGENKIILCIKTELTGKIVLQAAFFHEISGLVNSHPVFKITLTFSENTL